MYIKLVHGKDYARNADRTDEGKVPSVISGHISFGVCRVDAEQIRATRVVGYVVVFS